MVMGFVGTFEPCIFFIPFSKTISFFMEVFTENSALMYGLYSRAAYYGMPTVYEQGHVRPRTINKQNKP